MVNISNKKRRFPLIMGIVNVTPDSFSDGGNYFHTDNAVSHALRLIEQGADIIDIGGESSRPNAYPIALNEELQRVIPVIEEVKKRNPDCKISIDTVKYDVAKAAVEAGADMINDISGLESDIRLAQLAAQSKISLVIMHIKGNPRTMQLNPEYEDVVSEIHDFLSKKVELAAKMGVGNIFIDVGIGFGKNLTHNLELLKHLNDFSNINAGMLLGISRKSFIGQLLNIKNPIERDSATVLLHSLLLDQAVDIIRIHNVKMLVDLKILSNSLNL